MVDKNKPTEPGYYWARSEAGYRWWNLIVRIDGDPPFLSYKAWKISDNLICAGVDPSEFYFGPRIAVPVEPDWRS